MEMDKLIPQDFDFDVVVSPDGFINRPLDAFLANSKVKSGEPPSHGD